MKNSYWLLLFTLFLVAVFIISPITALKVEGAKVLLDVKPGTTYIFPMAVSIKADDSASEYSIDILGFGQTLDAGMYERRGDGNHRPDRAIAPVKKNSHFHPSQPSELFLPDNKKR